MRIALVRSPFIDPTTGVPIGLAYVQGSLKNKGHIVNIFDFSRDVGLRYPTHLTRNFTVKDKDPAVAYAYKRMPVYCSAIREWKPDIVGFHLSYSTSDYSLEMARSLSGYRLVAGGPEVNGRPEELQRTGLFRSLVRGYGEEAVHTALVQNGIVDGFLKKDTEYTPDYAGIEFGLYRGSYPILTTRGCPHRCAFCSQHTPYFYHTIKSVVEQIELSPKNCTIFLNDSNFNVNHKRTKELLSNVGKVIGGRRIHGFGFEVSPEFHTYLEEYRQCNFYQARVGIESGSRVLRDEMRKPRFTNEEVRTMVKQMTSCGTVVWAQFIFCYPGETSQQREETLELMHQLVDENPQGKVLVYWFRFVVHHGTEAFFKERYNVSAHSIRDWSSPAYPPGRVEELAAGYKKRLPKNANIHL